MTKIKKKKKTRVKYRHVCGQKTIFFTRISSFTQQTHNMSRCCWTERSLQAAALCGRTGRALQTMRETFRRKEATRRCSAATRHGMFSLEKNEEVSSENQFLVHSFPPIY